MSGAFGWGGKDRAVDHKTQQTGFGSAYDAYQQPGPATRGPARASVGAVVARPGATPDSAPNIQALATLADLTAKDLVGDAENIFVVSVDVTGSMGSWRAEIFKRLPLLFREAQTLLGQSLAILFIAFGDVKKGDRIWVTKFGSGPELDGLLASLPRDAIGGGDEEESPEMVAAYILKRVDVSKARNVYYWTITDERAAGIVDPPRAREHVGVDLGREVCTTKSVFDKLALKMQTFVVLRRTDQSNYDPDAIRASWESIIGRERVLPLDDGRRVVDVMLAVVAKTTGQTDAFQASLLARQGGTKYGTVNIAAVNRSVALVPNGAAPLQIPAARSKCLLPDGAAPMTAVPQNPRK